MKTKLFLLFTILSLQFLTSHKLHAQCKPMVLIDGNAIIADENDASGLKLPAWLKASQTLAKGQYVYSISVIEFTINGTTLDFSQNLSITTVQTVPAGKVWKIEAILKDIALPSFSGVYTYPIAGTYTFISPACSLMAKVQVWGAGGGGGGGYCNPNYSGSGGGGGGYAEGYYLMPPNTSYTVTVGAGGAGVVSNTGGTGGTSSVSVIGISATGGAGGNSYNNSTTGGAAGTGSGQLNFTGEAGETSGSSSYGGKGGDGANGGGGGGSRTTSNAAVGNAGSSGGGGGGGAMYHNGCGNPIGGNGGPGKVVITIGGAAGGSAGASSPCQVLYLRRYTGAGEPGACPSGWTQVDYQTEYGGGSTNYVRTCIKCP